MKSRKGWKQMLGVVLAGTMLLGCFVPIIYGGYKYYESESHVGITVNIKESADDVYKTAIDTIEKNKIYQITKRDDKNMVLSVQGITRKEVEGTVTVKPLRSNSSTFTVVSNKWKDVDPNVQKKVLINSVLSVCSELKVVCSEEEGKK